MKSKEAQRVIKARRFPISDVLTIVTGYILKVGGMTAVYELLNFMTRDTIFTHEIPRAARECRPHLYRQHPFLSSPAFVAEVDRLNGQLDDPNLTSTARRQICSAWVARQRRRYGARLLVRPIPRKDHALRHPLDDLIKMITLK